MKTYLPLLVALLTAFLAGCSSAPKQVSADLLQRQWSQRSSQTVRTCFFLGEAEGKVYLLLKTLPLIGSEPGESVISAPLKDLNPDLLNELRASASKSSRARKSGQVPKLSDLNRIRPF